MTMTFGAGDRASARDTDARQALDRVLASSDFDATERIRRFLSYVVDETLFGRAGRIKAYSIATSVFGRDESFDPQLDSIVRIVAGRMRRRTAFAFAWSERFDPSQDLQKPSPVCRSSIRTSTYPRTG